MPKSARSKTQTKNRIMPFALILLAQALAQPVVSADACGALIPPALSSRLSADMPGFQLPQSTDAGDTRVKELAANGGWPCPFVVAGDFDGNGSLDRALLIKSASGVRLISVLNNQGQWQVSMSEDWPLSLAESELSPIEPGLYQRGDAITQPVAQLDQLASLQADNGGFSAGKIAGRYAVYFYINSKWQKLTLKDE
jgi:hypothetical protein